MSSNIEHNYANHPIPDDKPTDEFTYVERRASIYQMLEDAGHPRALEPTQAELGDHFGVSQKQISKDIQRIREYEAERVGDNADTDTELVCRKAVMGLLEQGRFREAGELQLQYYDWLQSAGYKDREPDQVDLAVDGQHTHAHANLGAFSQDQAEVDGEANEAEAEGADGLTKRQRQHVDALTGGAKEIPVEAVGPENTTTDGGEGTDE